MRFIVDNTCYFCNNIQNNINIEYSTNYSLVFRDNYPVSVLHTLIVPRKHEENIFRLSSNEYEDLFLTVREVSSNLLSIDSSISGFNIGVNQGISAGQTIMHAHIHLIPRRKGDVDDPRGGVRWIFPDNAKYW